MTRILLGAWGREQPWSDDIRLDAKTHSVTWRGQTVYLDGYDWQILAFLGLRRGAPQPTAAIIEQIFGWRDDGGPLMAEKAVHVYTARLRKRLRLLPMAIKRNGMRGLELVLQ